MLIAGAKGFAKELLEVIFQINSTTEIFFFDNISSDIGDRLYQKFKVIKDTKDLPTAFRFDNQFALGIGGTVTRKKLTDLLTENGGKLKTIISPFAHIGHFNTNIHAGCTVMTGAVITNDVEIGEGTLINLNATIGHDSKIGKFCDISPGVHISGNCKIGDYCTMGTGSVILPRVKIGNNVIVGAGAVVNKDVTDGITVVGVPAKALNNS